MLILSLSKLFLQLERPNAYLYSAPPILNLPDITINTYHDTKIPKEQLLLYLFILKQALTKHYSKCIYLFHFKNI